MTNDGLRLYLNIFHNYLYNLFDDLESARFVNSCIMLLSSLGKQSNSTIVITAMGRKKENSEWILSPGGKHIMKSAKTGVYFLKKIENDLIIKLIDNNTNKFNK